MTDETTKPTPAQERRHRRVMKAFDTNPMICARCDVTFATLHAMNIERDRVELWDYLPASWKEGKERPVYKPWKPCQHPQDCKVEPRLRELFDDPPKPIQFPRGWLRAARKTPQ